MREALPGMLAILLVGGALVGWALWADWRSHRRVRALRTAPPRHFPELPAPDYVMPEDAGDEVVATQPLAEELEEETRGLAHCAVTGGLADLRQAREGSDRAVVRGPLVLVCPEGIGGVRELAPVLARLTEQKTPLVVVAPALPTDLLEALVVNRRHGLLDAIAVTASAADCVRVQEATGAQPVSRADLQAGWVPDRAFGRSLMVLADDRTTSLFSPAQGATPGARED